MSIFSIKNIADVIKNINKDSDNNIEFENMTSSYKVKNIDKIKNLIKDNLVKENTSVIKAYVNSGYDIPLGDVNSVIEKIDRVGNKIKDSDKEKYESLQELKINIISKYITLDVFSGSLFMQYANMFNNTQDIVRYGYYKSLVSLHDIFSCSYTNELIDLLMEIAEYSNSGINIIPYFNFKFILKSDISLENKIILSKLLNDEGFQEFIINFINKSDYNEIYNLLSNQIVLNRLTVKIINKVDIKKINKNIIDLFFNIMNSRY